MYGSAGAAAAAAMAAAQAHQLLVGGLLMQVSPEGFQQLTERAGGLVLTGRTKTSFLRRWKERLYFMPHQGITFYCRVGPEETLAIEGAVEVELKLGPLGQLI